MEEETVDPPPSLDAILHRVKPLYRYDQTPENFEGSLHYVQNGNPDHPFSYSPVKEGEATNLRELTEIDFRHAIVKEGTFKPTMREVVEALAYLPQSIQDKVHAAEILIERGVVKEGNFYLGKVKLYEKV
jgi:hypothetical protein